MILPAGLANIPLIESSLCWSCAPLDQNERTARAPLIVRIKDAVINSLVMRKKDLEKFLSCENVLRVIFAHFSPSFFISLGALSPKLMPDKFPLSHFLILKA